MGTSIYLQVKLYGTILDGITIISTKELELDKRDKAALISFINTFANEGFQINVTALTSYLANCIYQCNSPVDTLVLDNNNMYGNCIVSAICRLNI